MADQATHCLLALPVDSVQDTGIEVTCKGHSLHYLNAHSLQLMYHFTREQARHIVKKNCSEHLPYLPVPHFGVNPHGLVPNALWKMDVTDLTEFGHLKYIHVSIDIYSGFLCASLQTEETTM